MMIPMTRRRILKTGLIAVCGCFFPFSAMAGPDSYYIKNKIRLMSNFDEICRGAEQYLVPMIGQERAKTATSLAKDNFAIFLPDLPDVGGDANRNILNVIQAGWLAAIYTGMKAQGLSAKDAGRLFHDLCDMDLKSTPVEKLKAEGEAYFSSENYAVLRKWAKQTRLRTYPGDWVATVVFGNGKDFDVGHDYTECGAVKYFAAQNMPEISPYFCLNDFLLSRYQGTGLARSMTIAEGDAICNFRYKRARPVTQGWETETPRFKL